MSFWFWRCWRWWFASDVLCRWCIFLYTLKHPFVSWSCPGSCGFCVGGLDGISIFLRLLQFRSPTIGGDGTAFLILELEWRTGMYLLSHSASGGIPALCVVTNGFVRGLRFGLVLQAVGVCDGRDFSDCWVYYSQFQGTVGAFSEATKHTNVAFSRTLFKGGLSKLKYT